jgi:hypothetical protein
VEEKANSHYLETLILPLTAERKLNVEFWVGFYVEATTLNKIFTHSQIYAVGGHQSS